MKIPVFHDDQHGTAIIAAAAVLNGLELVGKDISNVKIACSGAGAAAIACLDQLVSLGVRMENILVTDAKGVVYEGRTEGMDPIKARYARPTSARTLGDIIEGADIFLGLSAGGVLKPDMVKRMAKDPLILAIGQPDAGESCRKKPRPCVPMPSLRRGALTIQTRSTTSCAFPSCSAAR
jgi:Malic enzyme